MDPRCEQIGSDAHRALNLQTAEQSLVLLRNGARSDGAGKVLPLKRGAKIAVVGPHAETRRGLTLMDSSRVCAQSEGGGDKCVESPAAAIARLNVGGTTVVRAGSGSSAARRCSPRRLRRARGRRGGLEPRRLPVRVRRLGGAPSTGEGGQGAPPECREAGLQERRCFDGVPKRSSRAGRAAPTCRRGTATSTSASIWFRSSRSSATASGARSSIRRRTSRWSATTAASSSCRPRSAGCRRRSSR